MHTARKMIDIIIKVYVVHASDGILIKQTEKIAIYFMGGNCWWQRKCNDKNTQQRSGTRRNKQKANNIVPLLTKCFVVNVRALFFLFFQFNWCWHTEKSELQRSSARTSEYATFKPQKCYGPMMKSWCIFLAVLALWSDGYNMLTLCLHIVCVCVCVGGGTRKYVQNGYKNCKSIAKNILSIAPSSAFSYSVAVSVVCSGSVHRVYIFEHRKHVSAFDWILYESAKRSFAYIIK